MSKPNKREGLTFGKGKQYEPINVKTSSALESKEVLEDII